MKRNLVLVIFLLIINISDETIFSQSMDIYQDNPLQLAAGMERAVRWDASLYSGNSELVSLQSGLFEVYLDSEFYDGNEMYAQGVRFLVSVPNEFSILLAPEDPIALPDFVDRFEFWVQGNNTKNRIFLLLMDEKDKSIEQVFVTASNFTGWKLNSLDIKPKKNISFMGYLIKPNPLKLDRSPQFVYFSQLAVSTAETAE